MQLPPTVLSTDKKDRKKDAGGKGKATTTMKKGKTVIPKEVAPEGEEEVSADEGMKDADAPETSKQSRLPGLNLRPSASLEVTLFDRLEHMYGAKIKRMLTVQYRYALLLSSFTPLL